MARTTSELEASNHRETRDVFSSTPIELQTVTTVPLHPLRIKPAGNAYTATENIKHALGNLFALPDELLVQILEFLDAASLNQLGCTCKALYAFSRLEDLWKTHCIG